AGSRSVPTFRRTNRIQASQWSASNPSQKRGQLKSMVTNAQSLNRTGLGILAMRPAARLDAGAAPFYHGDISNWTRRARNASTTSLPRDAAGLRRPAGITLTMEESYEDQRTQPALRHHYPGEERRSDGAGHRRYRRRQYRHLGDLRRQRRGPRP